MISSDSWTGLRTSAGLLIDSNLMVLFVVGAVNTNRIETFKRTAKYSKDDYRLLTRVLNNFDPLYTLAHVMAEVSNLTDLKAPERLQARLVLKETIKVLYEPEMPSSRAIQDRHYGRLGLVDAAISAAARQHQCNVLTDDFDLYVALSHDGVGVINFAHLQARSWGV